MTDEEATRRYRALGLPEAKLDKFLRSGTSLTTWYNWERFGGDSLKTGGTVLVVLGAISLVAGAVFTGLMLGHGCNSDDCFGQAYAVAIVGMPAMIAGGLELIAGIPMLAVGMLRMRRWAKEGELDCAPIQELERLRDQSRSKPKTTVSVLPYVTRGGGGFSLALRF